LLNKASFIQQPMSDIVWRFLIGGVIVSLFAILGGLFKPRDFAGLFGAAPSIALATLALAFHKQGPSYTSVEGRSMIAGALALLAYSAALWFLIGRLRLRVSLVAAGAIPVWFACAIGIWYSALR
jgi:uncharacterized membrane protein (GlpM family)